ncbi:GNAT family N-acetyltransferase [Tsukamurella soli]|uniref:GNAT family N-acetyltransferase n=1 Tax=Tsukamurella soli TaxID=644556 RepID=A0ABP8JGT0_9ACTN
MDDAPPGAPATGGDYAAARIVALSPQDATLWLPAALQIYVSAMNYPQGTEVHRGPMWREHLARTGYSAFGALAKLPTATGPVDHLVGVAYGYRGERDQWWNHQLRLGLRQRGHAPAVIDDMSREYFELTELHVHPTAQGRGLGARLLTALLTGRSEPRVLLSTPEVEGESNRAWRLYRTFGFTDVLRDFRFSGDPRPFAVLGRPLPLESRPAEPRPLRPHPTPPRP